MSTNRPFEFFVQWHLTERCNLRCKHCYQDERKEGDLSLAEIKEVVGEVSSLLAEWAEIYDVAFSPSFNITGGEPFLRQDLFEILTEIKRRGFDIFLLSNGTLVTKERARKLSDIGVQGVQVSIEGTDEIHDSIRGEGSFASSAEGIERLLDAGIKVTVNVTLSRLNAHTMRNIVAFASHMGVHRVGFSRLVPVGRGLSLLPEMLAPAEVKGLYGSLFSLDIRNLEIVTGDPIASQMKEKGNGDTGSTAISGCAAGVSGLTILSDGTLTPCRRLRIPIGNVRRDSLREVWATSPVLEALRDRGKYQGKCGRCGRWANCRGCRAIAYAYAKSQGKDDFLADDPQCFIE